MSTRIHINGGLFAVIDDTDADRVSQHTWWQVRPPHARTIYARTEISNNAVAMHRFILGLRPEDGLDVDHKNGNGLDNRRENLRLATTSQNIANAPKRRGAYTSRFKGVTRHSQGRWQALVTKDYQRHYLGLFDSEEDAARAYDEKARQLHGEFAWLNFPVVAP